MSLITRPSQLVFDADLSAAATLGDGIHLEAELPAAFKDANGLPRNMVILGPVSGNTLKGVDLIPLLDNNAVDNTDLVTLTLHRISLIVDAPNSAGPRSYRSEKLYTITGMLASSQTYAAGDVAENDAYKGIDTIPAPVLTDRATMLEAKVGANIAVHSPADNTPGVISIPDLDGAYALGIEVQVTTGSGLFNMLAEKKI